MLLLENLGLAISGLLANKMRAILTMLGIIIGIASVIAIVTVGNSLTNSITSSMESMGANNITVGLQQVSSETEVTESGTSFTTDRGQRQPADKDLFTDDMLEELKTNFTGEIKDISVSESMGNGTAILNNATANISLTGINEGYFSANELTLLQGTLLDERSQDTAKAVALVSDKLVNNLFNKDMAKAIGSTVEVQIGNKIYSYTIIGVYEYEANAFGFSSSSEEDITTSMYIPLSTAKKQLHSTSGFQTFTVVTETGTDSNDLIDRIKLFFAPYYFKNQDFEVSAYSLESIVSTMTTMLNTVSIAISIIAGISLLVGGIGVMNIMLVSISERTKEIGTRKALGASNSSIRLQFIIEAITICLIGGIIGVILGITLGSLASSLLGYAAQTSAASIIVALLFSMCIGVFFGYYPANRAAKMNPVDALRYE